MSEAVARWELPSINGPLVSRNRRGADPEAIEREAFEKGMAEGRQAGMQAAQQEQKKILADMERQAKQLQSVVDFMSKPLAELDVEVQQQLAGLACAIARHVVRRELKTHPDEIVAVIRDTVGLLPLSAREVRVYLNPEDAKLVRERLAEATADRAWSIAEDPVLTRGGCRVSSETSTIDAQLEQRLGAAIATVLGDERAHGRAE